MTGGAWGILLALCATLVLPGPAFAHSLLLESSPAANATVGPAPRSLVLRFNNRIEKKLSKIRLVGGAGEKLDLVVAVGGRADTLTTDIPALGPGLWRVQWQVLSTDGHVVNGTFSFRVSPTALRPARALAPERPRAAARGAAQSPWT